MSDDLSTPDAEEPRREHRYRGGIQYWDNLMDRLIQEARDAGKFDNLRGEGQPLEMDDNPHAGDKRLAYKILKDNDYTLPWIADRKALLEDIERWRLKIERFWKQFDLEWQTTASPSQEAIIRERWRRQCAAWDGEIGVLNRRIHNLNLQLPTLSLNLVPLSLRDELRRRGAPEPE